MNVSAVEPSQIAWRSVATTKIEKLIGSDEKQQRMVVEDIKPILYISKAGKIEMQSLPSTQMVDYLA
tara:strand:+ start:115 stop:315 length:201 start_codon:yes stop_codon:yes gene_type:complete